MESIADKVRKNSNELAISELKKNGIKQYMRPVAKERSIELNLMGCQCEAIDEYIIKLNNYEKRN